MDDDSVIPRSDVNVILPPGVISLAERRRKILEEAEDDDVLCVITVRANALVRTWVSNRIEDSTQYDWLHSKIAAASSEILSMENETR